MLPIKIKRRRWLQRLALSLVMAGVIVGGIAWIYGIAGSAREAQQASQCANNLKMIGLGLQSYHDNFGCFPPPYVTGPDGKPWHSWRLLILPLFQGQLPGQLYPIDIHEPWDSPGNLLRARQVSPAVYRCPASEQQLGSGSTNYVMIVGPEAASHQDECVSRDQIADGVGRTIIVAEIADSRILWTEPRDLKFSEMVSAINENSRYGISSHHVSGAIVLFADGHTEMLSNSLSPAEVRALVTSSGAD
jgi:prepilin-type processing-associated H-X9-DG protein